MNRDLKTQSALLALARTRRMQRAMAHAYLHRSEPPGTLRGALEFVTETACVTEDVGGQAGGIGHAMWIAGVDASARVAYVVEELGGDDAPPRVTGTIGAGPPAPIVYRLWLEGPRHGHLVPIHAWYEQAEDATEITFGSSASRVDHARRSSPVVRTTTEAWMLSTRVVQAAGDPDRATTSIRKFALQLAIEPTKAAMARSGKETPVTAFLRPNASLADDDVDAAERRRDRARDVHRHPEAASGLTNWAIPSCC